MLISCAFLNAQEITYFMGETQLTDGGQYEYSEGDFVSYGSETFGALTVNPDLKILCQRDATVNIRAISLTGQDIQMCAGGECVIGTDIYKQDVAITARKLKNLELEYIDVLDLNDLTPVIIKITTEVNNTIDNLEYGIQLTLNPTTKTLYTEMIYCEDVKVTNNAIIYQLDSECTLQIYNMRGMLIETGIIAGQGEYDLMNLQRGLYIYRIQGAKNYQGKIMLK